ncbi:hypothetical protein [Palleronia sp. LCG004]|uniref:hypothetical protein n=1 Tax=Palleronia sp. LCG004 TaxID=3079304 RepID=UPI0029430A86|nr:hypothetical protein [Palleronia sp. LCG004]WOI56724.1 hypothetical protein RVY76_02695 [Palleronia sp. LCG004]
MSESKFRSLDLQSKRSGGNRLWDLRDLDDYADRLEYDGEKTCENEIDEAAVAFRMATRTGSGMKLKGLKRYESSGIKYVYHRARESSCQPIFPRTTQTSRPPTSRPAIKG